ncbi:MAG: hypothetical protein KA291_02370 [Psychrobacter sp.]|nr:hypothetical protein [Psychrobacter sp.]
MNDKKDKYSADLEANLAKIANTKPRLRDRKNNIYERYITRVESVETIDIESTIESTVESIEKTKNEPAPIVANTEAYDEVDADLSARLLDSPVQHHILQPLENADELSSYEPLSAAELELFTIQEQDNVENTAGLQISNNSSTSVSLDFSVEENEKVIHPLMTTEATDRASAAKDEDTEVDNSAYVDEPISTASLTTLPIKKSKKNKAVKSKEKPANSKKLLIIGMVFGSLMISAAVFTLIATGFLSTGTTFTESDAAGTPVSKSITQTTSVTNKTANRTEMNTTEQNVETNTPPAVVEELSDFDTAKSSNPKSQTDMTNKENEAAVSAPKAETAITYEDFREESQNTLYRETND